MVVGVDIGKIVIMMNVVLIIVVEVFLDIHFFWRGSCCILVFFCVWIRFEILWRWRRSSTCCRLIIIIGGRQSVWQWCLLKTGNLRIMATISYLLNPNKETESSHWTPVFVYLFLWSPRSSTNRCESRCDRVQCTLCRWSRRSSRPASTWLITSGYSLYSHI